MKQGLLSPIHTDWWKNPGGGGRYSTSTHSYIDDFHFKDRHRIRYSWCKIFGWFWYQTWDILKTRMEFGVFSEIRKKRSLMSNIYYRVSLDIGIKGLYLGSAHLWFLWFYFLTFYSTFLWSMLFSTIDEKSGVTTSTKSVDYFDFILYTLHCLVIPRGDRGG